MRFRLSMFTPLLRFFSTKSTPSGRSFVFFTTECRFHSSEWLSYPNFCGWFFLDFSFEGLFRCFPRLDLSPRKLPAIFEFSVSPLGSEDFVLVDNQCSHNVDSFQCCLPFSPYLQYILLYYGNYVNFRKTKKARAGTPTTDHLPCRTLA